MRYDERPLDNTPVHTADLPPTPIRDRNVPATAWVEAPADLSRLGDDLPGRPIAEYKRRIGTWLLWRAGPAKGADARYWANPPYATTPPPQLTPRRTRTLQLATPRTPTLAPTCATPHLAAPPWSPGQPPTAPPAAPADRLDDAVTLRLFPDGSADGLGPGGTHHTRFRSWKEDLRDT